MTIERFEPTEAQQERLDDEAYAALAAITLAMLLALESTAQIPTDPAQIDDYVAELQAQLERDMSTPTEALLAGDAAIAQWERDISEAAVAAVLLGLLIAAGGVAGLRSQFSPRGILRFSKASVLAELQAVRFNAGRIAAGELTPAQIAAGIKRRSRATRGSVERTKHSVLIASGAANEGRRFLGSPHPCPNCPDYQELDWVPLWRIVPVATLCVCQSRCKCRVQTRFNPQRALEELTGGTFSDRIQRAAEYQSQVEERWRSSWDKGR